MPKLIKGLYFRFALERNQFHDLKKMGKMRFSGLHQFHSHQPPCKASWVESVATSHWRMKTWLAAKPPTSWRQPGRNFIQGRLNKFSRRRWCILDDTKRDSKRMLYLEEFDRSEFRKSESQVGRIYQWAHDVVEAEAIHTIRFQRAEVQSI